MILQNGSAIHLVLFGTLGESRYFLRKFKDKFDLIGFNANMIAFAPEGMAAFISQLKNKTYFIDPQTYAFQQPVRTLMKKKDGSLTPKKSLERLARLFGSKISEIFGNSSLVLSELTPVEYETISKNVLTFQRDFIQSNVSEEIKEFLGDSILQPAFIIAPYMYLEVDDFGNELKSNIIFIEQAKKNLKDEEKLFAEIALSQDVINQDNFIDEIAKEYNSANVDGYIIWIDDFSEIKASEFLLKKYKLFLQKLSLNSTPILMLHGSYLSVIFSSDQIRLLAGVGHGIEYGESRALLPVGGGVPTAKFYFPNYHYRIDYDPTTQDILLKTKWISSMEAYFDNVCSCDVCRDLIKSDSVDQHFQKYGETKISEKNGKAYPTGQALHLSREHYLYNKIKEYSTINSLNLLSIITSLEKADNQTKLFQREYPISHLARWKKVVAD